MSKYHYCVNNWWHKR